MDITCLLQMWETLHNEHGVRELRTRQLNQDCVENLFSIIRSKGGARDNPDAQQFRAAMSQVFVAIICTCMSTFYLHPQNYIHRSVLMCNDRK